MTDQRDVLDLLGGPRWRRTVGEGNQERLARGSNELVRYATRFPPFVQSELAVVLHRTRAVRLAICTDGGESRWSVFMACGQPSISYPLFHWDANDTQVRHCRRCFSDER